MCKSKAALIHILFSSSGGTLIYFHIFDFEQSQLLFIHLWNEHTFI